MENSTIIAIIILIAIVVALIIIIKFYFPEKVGEIGTPEVLDNIVKFNTQPEVETEEE